jgi:hypothetical protein
MSGPTEDMDARHKAGHDALVGSVMRGRKRVEDARERAYDPRIHPLCKKLLRRRMDCRVKPGNDEVGAVMPDLVKARVNALVTRASILFAKGSYEGDGWPGQARP